MIRRFTVAACLALCAMGAQANPEEGSVHAHTVKSIEGKDV